MTCNRLLMLLLMAVLACASGCKRTTDVVQQHAIPESGKTLEQAFAELLSEPTWTTEKRQEFDPESGKRIAVPYATVAGNLANTRTPFSATYRVVDGVAPVFTSFTVNGKKREADSFAEFLSDYYLARSLHNK